VDDLSELGDHRSLEDDYASYGGKWGDRCRIRSLGTSCRGLSTAALHNPELLAGTGRLLWRREMAPKGLRCA
jgi:hypothetical protein